MSLVCRIRPLVNLISNSSKNLQPVQFLGKCQTVNFQIFKKPLLLPILPSRPSIEAQLLHKEELSFANGMN
jgi:hypothetical protein